MTERVTLETAKRRAMVCGDQAAVRLINRLLVAAGAPLKTLYGGS